MKISRPSSPLAVAVIIGALIIGGTGGAIAAGQIGTHQIRNGAVTTAKLHKNAVTSSRIHNRTVKATDLAKSARGAKVVQYSADATSISAGSPNLTVQLPGTWTMTKLAASSWSVSLVRNSGNLYVLGVVDANTGEGPDDGWAINLSGAGVASVSLYAPSYAVIDTVRITRTIATSQLAGTVARGAHKAQPHTSR
jgi:hypothetical protein